MMHHAGKGTIITNGYTEPGRKLLIGPARNINFNIGAVGMLSIYIFLAMANCDMLIEQGIKIADVMWSTPWDKTIT